MADSMVSFLQRDTLDGRLWYRTLSVPWYDSAFEYDCVHRTRTLGIDKGIKSRPKHVRGSDNMYEKYRTFR